MIKSEIFNSRNFKRFLYTVRIFYERLHWDNRCSFSQFSIYITHCKDVPNEWCKKLKFSSNLLQLFIETGLSSSVFLWIEMIYLIPTIGRVLYPSIILRLSRFWIIILHITFFIRKRINCSYHAKVGNDKC